MPLVQITTTSDYYPAATLEESSRNARQILAFGNTLPSLIINNGHLLHLEVDTPEVAVQVSHRAAHPFDMNVPDIWIEIRFTEANLNEVQQTEAVAVLKELILGWFNSNPMFLINPSIALDCFWGPGHGFLVMHNISSDW